MGQAKFAAKCVRQTPASQRMVEPQAWAANPLYGAVCALAIQAALHGAAVAGTPELDPATEKLSGDVHCVAFSPDGKTLAVAGDLNCNSLQVGLLLWDLDADCQRLVIKKGLTRVYSLAYSPDGTLFATTHGDGSVRVWETATCKQVADLKRHTERVVCVAFSPDGKTLATGGYDSNVVLWDVAGKKEKMTLAIHTDEVRALAFSPDGKTVATASCDGTLQITSAETGKAVGLIVAGDDAPYFLAVAFSPDGKTLAAGGPPEVTIWDAGSRKKKGDFKGHETSVTTLAFSPDGKWLASGSQNGRVKLWDLRAGKEACPLKAFSSGPCSVCFSPDSKFLAVGGGGNQVKLWETATGKEIRAKKEDE